MARRWCLRPQGIRTTLLSAALLALVVTSSLIIAGCYEVKTGGSRFYCADSGDCPGNQRCCSDGYCRKTCGADADADSDVDVDSDADADADGLCPNGQDCTDLTGNGAMGCTKDGEVPPDPQTSCHLSDGCEGNFTCYFIDQEQTESACIENCGTCPAGQECTQITTMGVLGCTDNDQTPAGNPTGCHEESSVCDGNFNCYFSNEEQTESVCIQNCSSPR